jgi:hypothetical protein
MIRNATVTILQAWTVKDGQGIATKNWNPSCLWIDGAQWNDSLSWMDVAPTFACDFQPANLDKYQREVWGIDDLRSNARKLFLDVTGKSFWPFINDGNRIVFNARNFDIMGSNQWSRHVEALGVPAQGE